MPPSATGYKIPADPKLLQKLRPKAPGMIPKFTQEELGQLQTLIHADPSLASYFKRFAPEITALA